MSLSSLINNGGRLFGIKIARTVSSIGNKLAEYGIAKSDYSFAGDSIFFKRFNITLAAEKALPLLQGYENAIKLLNNGGAEFFTDPEGFLNIKINNVQFKINDEEELFILYEVFLENTYNLISPTTRPIALIDIGMNVGITSLFFAARPNVEKVFSFEPFLPTFNMALHNIGLNKSFSGKISPNNFGLAKDDGSLYVPYSLSQKGRMGLSGLPKKSNKIKQASEQEIFLKQVNNEFVKIKENTSGNFIVCKVDCEGAEYEIVDSLHKANLLSLPDVYFIEWHYKSPDEMVSKLANANFNVINTTFANLNSGMIYAMRNT